MACSKLFSGDLPEMTIHIIKYLVDDIFSLHSCILVNRFWCRLAIPLLWKDPFSTVYRKEFHHQFLDIYFLFLNDDDKQRFKMYKVGHRMNSFSFKPLFNYPSFIKTLNIYQLELHVINWLKFIQQPPQAELNSLFITDDQLHESLLVLGKKKNSLSTRYYKMTNTLCILLFKLFINNNACLNSLSINIRPQNYNVKYQKHFFVEVCDFILKKPEFISKLENFTLKSIPGNFRPFLSSLSSILSSNKNLNFYPSVNSSLTQYLKELEKLIQSRAHLHLSSLTFSITTLDIGNINYLCYAFKCCSKTLTSIRFSDCNLRHNCLPFKPLKYLTQLKSLHFNNCKGLNLQFIQPLLDISTPLRIKSLTIGSNVSFIQLLIQKIGTYLENLFIYISTTETLDCIINYCENIKFLYLYYFKDTDLPKLFQLISHFKDNIEYLTIRRFGPYSIILKELGQHLPVKLKYLILNIPNFEDDLKIFLNSCKNIELKNLLIKTKDSNDNLQILKSFIQEKNLKYLSYVPENFNDESEELIKEIQSFVKIRRYEYLILDMLKSLDVNLDFVLFNF